MGLGKWLDKKIRGTEEERKERKEQAEKNRLQKKELTKELDEIRWNAYVVERKKQVAVEARAKARKGGGGGVLNMLAKIGDYGKVASEGIVHGLTLNPEGDSEDEDDDARRRKKKKHNRIEFADPFEIVDDY